MGRRRSHFDPVGARRDARHQLELAARTVATRDNDLVLLTAIRLIRKAEIARDLSDTGITRKSTPAVIAREANAAAGGPLMTPDEFNEEIGDEIPFDPRDSC